MKTNEELRLEAIKKAWGYNYSDGIDCDGWLYLGDDCRLLDKYNTSIVGEWHQRGYNPFKTGEDSHIQKVWIRPQSLKHIDSNNGWTRIEPNKSNLQVGEFEFLVSDEFSKGGEFLEVDKMKVNINLINNPSMRWDVYSHYRELKREVRPFY